MQNKPNFPDAQMNVTSILTKDYENETAFRLRQNKPNLSRRSLWRSRIKPNWTAEHFTEKGIDSPRLTNKIRRSSND